MFPTIVKLDLDQAAKVPEYLAVLLYEQEVPWHILADGKYRVLDPDADGILRSKVFPGLWLDPPDLLAGESAKVLKVLQAGLQSPEHERFVAELGSRKRSHG